MHVRIQGNNVMIEVIRGVDGCNNNIHYFLKKYHYHNKYLPARKKEMNVSLRGFSPFFPGCFHMDYDSAGGHMPVLSVLLSRYLIWFKWRQLPGCLISLKCYLKNNIIKQEYQHIHCKGLFHKYGFSINSYHSNLKPNNVFRNRIYACHLWFFLIEKDPDKNHRAASSLRLPFQYIGILLTIKK